MADAEPEPASADNEAPELTGPQLEKFRRDLAEFVRLETQLAAIARAPQLRRAGADALAVMAAAIALLALFAFINVAIVLAIATVLPSWAAALILAGVWLCVAGLAGGYLARDGARLRGLVHARSASPTELTGARDAAWQAVRDDLATVAPPLAERAIATAAPFAARLALRMAEHAASNMAEGVVEEVEDASRDVIEESEEVVETLAAEVPGAGIATTVWDLALLPGRTGVRLVTTVLKRPPPPPSDD